MVRQWLDDCGFQSAPEFRKMIESVTGYWTTLLYQLHGILKQHGSGSQASAEALVRAATTSLTYSAELFGLKGVDAGVVLKQFAFLELPAGIEDLASVLDLPSSMVLKAIQWANLLGIVRPSGGGAWQIDRIVAQILNGAA